MVLLSGLLCSGAPGDIYGYRSAVNTSGSTHLVIAFMGLTSSRDVTVSRTLSTRTRSRPTHFPDHRPDRLATRSPANGNADVPRRSHASANELASEPCRDAPVDQATAIPAISAPPFHISTDALLRIGRNTTETNMAGYQ
jgi:hypothetical protein